METRDCITAAASAEPRNKLRTAARSAWGARVGLLGLEWLGLEHVFDRLEHAAQMLREFDGPEIAPGDFGQALRGVRLAAVGGAYEPGECHLIEVASRPLELPKLAIVAHWVNGE